MQNLFTFILPLLLSKTLVSQVVLEANGPGNTYSEITSVLAPSYNPIEVPDCGHSSFGNHIDEVYDSDLSSYAFRFFIHVNSDNDRCLNFDRQRNEIKSYDKSPDNLLGVENEKVIYKWTFKLPNGFQSSTSFTHIHQLKSVGGSYASMPMYTLTTRKSSPDRLELRYAQTTSQITLKHTPLNPLIGVWIEATEKIEYTNSGFYSIELKNKSTGEQLFYYDNTLADKPKINWRPGGTFVRPKWGIYRSLNAPKDLRDEEVLFSYFSVEEVQHLSLSEVNSSSLTLYPNPTNNIIYANVDVTKIEVFDFLGKRVAHSITNEVNVASLPNSIYFVRAFYKNGQCVKTSKIYKTD